LGVRVMGRLQSDLAAEPHRQVPARIPGGDPDLRVPLERHGATERGVDVPPRPPLLALHMDGEDEVVLLLADATEVGADLEGGGVVDRGDRRLVHAVEVRAVVLAGEAHAFAPLVGTGERPPRSVAALPFDEGFVRRLDHLGTSPRTRSRRSSSTIFISRWNSPADMPVCRFSITKRWSKVCCARARDAAACLICAPVNTHSVSPEVLIATVLFGSGPP